jgi:NAD(P)H-hydrate epimerase
MKVVTAGEMKEIDRKAMKDFCIPGLVLMENAGMAVARKVREMLEGAVNPRVLVVSGKGNNGGDGCVAARQLKKSGIETTVLLIGRKRDIKGDARVNVSIVSKLLEVVEVSNQGFLKKLKAELESCDLVVDAIVGTGANDRMKGLVASAITAVRECNKPVVCVDIPSGLDADNGLPLGVCVRGTETVTLGLPKAGLLLHPGASFAGKLTVADIGFPDKLLESKNLSLHLLQEKEIASLLPQRPPDAHKGSMGRVLVLAGSCGYTGAAVLTSMGALRSGCGLVTLGVPRSLNTIFEIKLTEVITRPLPETEAGTLGLEAEGEILDMVERADALAVGPGLARHPETQALVRKLMMTVEKPMVIDADALNILEGDISLLERRHAPTVITPHPGEMGRLLGVPASEVQAKRISLSRETAVKQGIVVVLKGARTVIAGSDGNAFINPTGNSGMASAGMGDVLTGIIASLVSQGIECLEAAKAGVFLHGLAGDLAADAKGKEAMIAGDLLDSLPEAFKKLVNIR